MQHTWHSRRTSPKRWEDVKAEEARRRVRRPDLESDLRPRWSAFAAPQRAAAHPTTDGYEHQTQRQGELSPSPPRHGSGAVQVIGLSPDGMNPVLKAQAQWEREKASLQGSCDALQASLARERAWRTESERRTATLSEENAALREALSAALGTPFDGGGVSGPGSSNEVMVPLRQYADLLGRARAYRQTLEDLKTLQQYMQQQQLDTRGDEGLFTAFPLEIAPLPYNPLVDDMSFNGDPPSSSPPALAAPPKPKESVPPAPSAPLLSLSPSVPPTEQPSSVNGAAATGEGTRLRSPSGEVSSPPPPRREGTVTPTPTPLRSGQAPSPPPPPPHGGSSTRLPVSRALLGGEYVCTEIARPTTLTGSALKVRLAERGAGSSRTAVESELEQLNDWQQSPMSPPPKNPCRQPVWRGDDNSEKNEVNRREAAPLHLSRLPRIEVLLPGKLDVEMYSYVDELGREKSRQRWTIANRTADRAYTVEFRFVSQTQEQNAAMQLLSDAHLTQDGRCVMRVAAGERKPFLSGYPGRHTVVVRCDGSEEEKAEEGVGRVGGTATRAQDGLMATTLPPSSSPPRQETGSGVGEGIVALHAADSREPSRRSETLPPQPCTTTTSVPSSIDGCPTAATAASSVTQPFPTGAVAHDAAESAEAARIKDNDGITRGGGASSLRLPDTRASNDPAAPHRPPPLTDTAASTTPTHGLVRLPDEVAAQTDKLTLRLARELRALAVDCGVADNPTALAALCRRRGVDYVDVDFPPVTASLGNGAAGCRLYSAQERRTYFIRWCPVAAYTPENRRADLTSSVGVDPCALRVGMLGDNGVVAALAALAESAGAVTSVLASTTAEDEANGVLSAWLCDSGEWRLSQVDAYLPCVTDGLGEAPSAVGGGAPTLYGCANIMSCDIWGSVCEKALAKLLGSYRALRSVSAATALGMLTGGPVEVWDWWHQNAEAAFDEMEAAINTNGRGTGIVLITTRSAIATGVVSALRRRSGAASSLEEVELSFRAAGLRPDMSYRVLAASENAHGEPMLLIRNWQQRSLDEEQATRVTTAAAGLRQLSPERGGAPTSLDANLNQATTVVRDSESCIWLNYDKEVLPFFRSCHVCFDCRRYHDVRVPIRFRVEGEVGHSLTTASLPAVPSHLLRVTVKHRSRAGRERRGGGGQDDGDEEGEDGDAKPLEPARLWIGLHQPSGTSAGSEAGEQLPHGLKLTLVGHDAARTQQNRHATETALRPPCYYVLAESYDGVFQQLPSVWMYLELEPPARGSDVIHATTTTASAPPRTSSCHSSSSSSDTGDAGGSSLAFYILPQLNTMPTTQRTHNMAVPPAERTAFVALLAEDKSRFDVQLLVAPEEMKAAMYHDVLERLDLDNCALVARPPNPKTKLPSPGRGTSSPLPHATEARPRNSAWCQVNGRWKEGFCW